MPVITAIEEQRHDPERVNVFIDGEFELGASRLLLLSRRLHVGSQLSREEIESLRHDDTVDRAYAAAINLLSYRPRSRREIEDYFRRKSTEPAVASAVVERLIARGLIDDGEFAAYWIRNRQTFKPRGSRALRAELRGKGLDSEVIDGALETLGDEVEDAYRAGEAKRRAFERLDPVEFRRKMIAFLQRRGFPYPVALAAANRHVESRDAEMPDDDALQPTDA